MLSAEPDNVQNFVERAKCMLVNYHSLTNLNTLSLVELPMQSKFDQLERSLLISGILQAGPTIMKYLPSAISVKLFDKMVNDYLKCDLYKNDLSAILSADDIRYCMKSLLELTRGASQFTLEMDHESSFKMCRLLWMLVFSTKSIKGYNHGVYPFAALYPLLDDVLDSPMYSKFHKTRLMENIHNRLDTLYKNSENIHPITPPVSGTSIGKEDPRIDQCLDSLLLELKNVDPLTKRSIIESLDVIRYAEELDYLDDRETDAYTRCTVKGASTIRTLLLISTLTTVSDEALMAYGFITQMIDDLQDCRSDAEHNIATPFSAAIKRSANLDADIIKLIQFIQSPYIEELIGKSGPLYAQFKFLNSLFLYLIMEASVHNRVHLSVQLYKDLRHRLPVKKGWCKRRSLEHEAFKWLRSVINKGNNGHQQFPNRPTL